MSVSVSDSFFKFQKKGKFGLYFFLSKDWKTKKPWTYNNTDIPYLFSKHILEREVGVMTTWFVGPLCVVFYKMKL